MKLKKTGTYLNTYCTFIKRWSDHYGETGNLDDKPRKKKVKTKLFFSILTAVVSLKVAKKMSIDLQIQYGTDFKNLGQISSRVIKPLFKKTHWKFIIWLNRQLWNCSTPWSFTIVKYVSNLRLLYRVVFNLLTLLLISYVKIVTKEPHSKRAQRVTVSTRVGSK